MVSRKACATPAKSRGFGSDDNIAHHREFIDQPDVDHSERVFEQLDHLGDVRRADTHNCVERLRVEELARFRAGSSGAADNLRNVLV